MRSNLKFAFYTLLVLLTALAFVSIWEWPESSKDYKPRVSRLGFDSKRARSQQKDIVSPAADEVSPSTEDESDQMAEKDATTEPAPIPEPEVEDTGPTHLLRGYLSTKDGLIPGDAKLSVKFGKWDYGGFKPYGSREVSGQGGRSTGFELDASSLFDIKDKLPSHTLLVNVDHPQYVPARVEVDIPEASLDWPRPVIFYADVSLVRAAFVSGTVRGPQNEPVEGAKVGVFLIGKRSDPDNFTIARAVTRESGSYWLRVGEDELEKGPKETERKQLVIAFKKGLLPAHEFVALAAGKETVVPELLLSKGLEVEGRALLLPENQPAANWEIRTRGWYSTLRFMSHSEYFNLRWRQPFGWRYYRFSPNTVAWDRKEKRVLPQFVGGKVDAQGYYRLEGLATAKYTLSPHPSSEAGFFAHPSIFEYPTKQEWRVEPPAKGVDFQIPVAWIQIEVRDGGERLEGADLHLALPGKGWVDGKTNKAGRAKFAVAQHLTYLIKVRGGEYEAYERTIDAPEQGKVQDVSIALLPSKSVKR